MTVFDVEDKPADCSIGDPAMGHQFSHLLAYVLRDVAKSVERNWRARWNSCLLFYAAADLVCSPMPVRS